MTDWTPDRIGDLTGRRAFVTGATSGIGRFVALELVRHGAEVVVGARDSEKARELRRWLESEVQGARTGVVPLDLGSLSSVRAGAEWARTEWDGFDLLVNNAGIMAAPRRRSPEGFELHLATNHLAHFTLTALLWPRLAARDGRVVTVSSLFHTLVDRIDLAALTPLGSSRRYVRYRAYAESKLANLVFALELDRRLRDSRSRATSMAAHPGYASTGLFKGGPSIGARGPWSLAVQQVSRVVGQPAALGAWPVLMAATAPGLASGSYVGPSGQGGLRGTPQLVGWSSTAGDPRLGRDLWEASERAAGLTFRP
ncbi:SDR family NAD(P)-dependent oxidoreductase [Solicola sp. PLA-1-18]|uniref:SDR family NAD(P)-dependent oxidoreductase n=1 Tax=Solicola sp. PLA-1-18 TaxID=3380532 RepID=UPI003B82927E